jgi:hypothetical protein
VAYTLPQTTAELLLRAAEAAHILGPAATTTAIGEFLGTPARAAPALAGAKELSFVEEGTAGEWTGTRWARVAASVSPQEKAVVLRMQLEDYEPYVLFRNRLVAGEEPTDAARQVCVTFGITTDELDARSFLIDCGTFSGSLTYGHAQRLLVNADESVTTDAMTLYEGVLAERDAVIAHIAINLGPEAAGFVTGDIFDYLVDSYLAILNGSPLDGAMFQLGKGVETFVKRLATRPPSLTLPSSVKTLGQVARHLKDHGRLKSKHHSLVIALTDVRNAADHTVDAEIGASWQFSRQTAIAASHLTWAFMRSFLAVEAGDFQL